MVRILLISLVLLFTFQLAQSQVTDSLTVKSKQEMYDFYSSKHKKLKRTGFILLGVGVVASITGILIASTQDSNDVYAGVGLFLLGTAPMIASIPVFVIAGSKKRKSKAVLGSGEVGIGTIPFNDTRYASVGVKISFWRENKKQK